MQGNKPSSFVKFVEKVTPVMNALQIPHLYTLWAMQERGKETTINTGIPTTRIGGITQISGGVIIKEIRNKISVMVDVIPQAPTNSMEETMKKMMSDMQRMMIDQQKLITDNQNRDLTVHVNVPLVDMLQGIPKYAKYIKDIIANKSRFTEKLGLGVPRPTTIVLGNDKWLARPEGIIEDVLVQVGSLIIPADFVILDFEPDPEVPFILGRPFLATGRALIDVAAGQLTMRVHDKVEVFNVYKALKMPAIYEELSAITVLNDDTRRPLITSHDPLERALVGDDIFGDSAAFEMVQILDMASIYIREGEFEPLDRKMGVTPKLSIEEPPKLELKPLPAHLKYAFLGEGNTLPVILAAELTDEEVSVCLEVLKSHKRALGWQISDI
ncbi:uncharacterized protein LOC132031693 [Lycium ferocissimum]|uniref:uncharacterized protein LOC132031693 n=1 Tax=Lycium ferocissimum TaxID=112874 RepID=UPI0028155D85|nr:uncharacterized protein LOC132031693 [Lycium ferocissimum]